MRQRAARGLLDSPALLAVAHALEIEPPGEARTTRIARLLGVGVRAVQIACRELRERGHAIPHAPPGAPVRVDYERSRRRFRRKRVGPPPAKSRTTAILEIAVNRDPGDRGFPPTLLTPLSDPATTRPTHAPAVGGREGSELRAVATGIAPSPDRLPEAERLLGRILSTWPASDPRYGRLTPGEAGHCVRMLTEGLGASFEEAAEWFGAHAPALDLARAHTPWRAAASREHAGAWLAARRSRKQTEAAALARERDELRRERAELREGGARCAPPPEAVALAALAPRRTRRAG